ncbi:hypothetical protein [Blastochloris sulfoviridis]|uniref:Uncharacterized protein n=1 Tax=Blastochloris sulfoviridis TaxID=50712 RepID=A0A5M6I109_9HYPH|nr:hypothetical protein [Blastochloris sulfoviridis]KAA5601870.1 hypothetical protein F1193_08040 [Blastochloris sulfoviridis]
MLTVPSWYPSWYSWRASLEAVIAGAVSGVGLLTLFAAVHGTHFDGATLFFMLGVALPAALVVAAPVGFVILPLARLVLDKIEAYTAGRLVLVGAATGFVLPLAVAWRFHSGFVTGSWVLMIIFVVAATAGGAIGALAFHRRMAQVDRA